MEQRLCYFAQLDGFGIMWADQIIRKANVPIIILADSPFNFC